MVNISETTQDDISQIAEWIAADPWHSDDPKWQNPENMITGHGLFSFCLEDKSGPLAYVQLLDDGDNARIAMQFAPDEIVSKRRLIVGLIQVGIPVMKGLAEGFGKKGLVFETFSPLLIGFAEKNGFKRVDETDDYRLAIEEQTHV